MANVYRVESIHGDGTEYYSTAREADRARPGGERPESIIRVDAAAECNRLERYADAEEARARTFRYVLGELLDACFDGAADSPAIRRARKIVADHPLPPADAADRGGPQSYGT